MKQEQLLVGLGRWGGPIREDFHGAFRTGPGVGPVRRKRADLVDLKSDIEFDRSENLFIGPLDGNATDGRQAVLRHEHGVIGVELHDGVDIRGVQGVWVALQLSGNGGRSAFVGLRRTRGTCLHLRARALAAEFVTELPPFLAAEPIRDGRLAEVFVDHPMPEQHVSLLYPAHRHPSSIVRAYLDFCQKQMTRFLGTASRPV